MADFAAGRAAFTAAACFFARVCAARSFAAALLLLALAGLRAVLVFVTARVAAAAVRAFARTGRAFAALGFRAFPAVEVERDFKAARALVALALRDFSVFLTDDIRAHSFFVPPGGETQSCSKGNFAARGTTAAANAPRDGRARIIHYRSANLGPQAIAACRKETPDAPLSIRFRDPDDQSRADYGYYISHSRAKIKDSPPEKAEMPPLSGALLAPADRRFRIILDASG